MSIANSLFVGSLRFLERTAKAISPRFYWKFAPRLAEELNLVYAGPDSAGLKFLANGAEVYYRATRVLTKEPDTVAWIDGFAAGDVLWDIGANVGVYSLYAAAKRGVKALAFEPSYFNFGVLCHNIRLNGVEDLVVPVPFALNDRNSIDMLNLGSSGAMPGGAGNSFGSTIDNGGESFRPAARMAVMGMSGDAFAATFGADLPTHIKIDIDGNQVEVLRGMASVLRHPGLKSIMFETTPSRPDVAEACVAILAESGWQQTRRHGPNTYYARVS